jgi:hypothetical protein
MYVVSHVATETDIGATELGGTAQPVGHVAPDTRRLAKLRVNEQKHSKSDLHVATRIQV